MGIFPLREVPAHLQVKRDGDQGALSVRRELPSLLGCVRCSMASDPSAHAQRAGQELPAREGNVIRHDCAQIAYRLVVFGPSYLIQEICVISWSIDANEIAAL